MRHQMGNAKWQPIRDDPTGRGTRTRHNSRPYNQNDLTLSAVDIVAGRREMGGETRSPMGMLRTSLQGHDSTHQQAAGIARDMKNALQTVLAKRNLFFGDFAGSVEISARRERSS